jgi:Protein of unknown function (DUF2752)
MAMSVGAMTGWWRGLSPVQNALARLTAITMGLLWLAWLPRPHTVCPLLMLTGIPCPFCGGTHAGVDLGRGHPLAALRASPLAVSGAVVLVALPVLRRTALAERWRELPPRRRSLLSAFGIVSALVISEIWQLARFGHI